eukprot:2567012-Pleurochrysis_carterae.AAC.1
MAVNSSPALSTSAFVLRACLLSFHHSVYRGAVLYGRLRNFSPPSCSHRQTCPCCAQSWAQAQAHPHHTHARAQAPRAHAHLMCIRAH